MASPRRIEKLNNLLRKELAKIIDRELELPEGNLATLTRVLISQDLNYAAVFISVTGEEPKEVLEILNKNIYHIQQLLNQKLRMRPVPKIHFEVDKGEITRERIEKSIALLKQKGEL